MGTTIHVYKRKATTLQANKAYPITTQTTKMIWEQLFTSIKKSKLGRKQDPQQSMSIKKSKARRKKEKEFMTKPVEHFSLYYQILHNPKHARIKNIAVRLPLVGQPGCESNGNRLPKKPARAEVSIE